ncbi:bifunctional UDP-N-acetylmuramoyl-tripeptide:D-alanyl-D-alanine ligase/alanine racemase [Hymenobacter lapidiphilus]|uniref:Alanine racemase n=1 Tax=Hymenobacter lapidiphilus TaxID=2608003 RepID=A0A7Y7PP84_9BACT|nr:bifunctional UDP-N-acetylmuramoyl-tripeptide:D-alanyl-D-alanine ligase/alanine racemase [Hymenobacter lapidiphilus]NVO31476.1 bifunctional UDP-N-acetylmuramoyl-tripeptide:D-alanyl-D-alanine ligase/alanine racemase [Hymenobacter lapidiphilus]
MLQFSDLSALLGGTVFRQPTAPAPVQRLLLDSRRVETPADSLFFALRGPQHDGHRYLPELYRAGVRQFVVEAGVELPGGAAAYPEAGLLAVDDVLAALQALAAHHRRQFALPVFGITGSNGKTIVKEWLAQLLSPDELVCKSPRSYNSQVGVPLSVWELNARHSLGIFEAGISEPGEMARLARVIQPTLGIFTNLGTAHDAGFVSWEEKVTEKMRLFEQVETLFYCADHPPVHAAARHQLPPERLAAWTRQRAVYEAGEARWLVSVKETLADRTVLRLKQAGAESHTFTLPFADEPSLENALHGLVVLLHRELAPDEIQRRLERLQPVAMRLEMKQALNGCYVLDDTYNNDLAGLRLALDALSRQPRRLPRTLILSDVLESGLEGAELYARVAALLPTSGVVRLIGVGPDISRHQVAFTGLQTHFYPDTDALLADFRADDFREELLLVKGARRYGFERVVAALQQKLHGTVLEVNLDALVHNLNFYRRRLRPGVKLMVMVKAFAYGSGSTEVANLLQFHRADYLAVAYADEGVELRRQGISLPIMVMNPAPDSFATLRQYHLEPEIYSFELLQSYLNAAQQAPLPPIHLKLDTGMRRLGFGEEDVAELGALLHANAVLVPVASILTHLASADEAGHDGFSRGQLAAFGRLTAVLEHIIGYPVLKHALNTAGILRFPEAQFDMVRLGIGLYGVEASGQQPDALRPVSRLRTTVSQVKTLPAGYTVGYGRRGEATSYERRIATLAIGYADGYDRRFGNGVGEVLIRGQRAPIVGSVCMDMCMADVTDLPNVLTGDEAVVFGEGLPLPALAARIGTIAYELLTNVSERVKRVFVAE